MSDPESKDAAARFEAAAEQESPSVLVEFVAFLGHNKKWWLLPILIVLGVVGVLVAVGGTTAGPFLYTFF